MENNNGKGQNILYLVVGIATLVVAIIGATFAYFSAAATVTGDEITGNTEDLTGALTLNVERVRFEEAGANSDNLVPTDLTADVAGINAAITKKCVGNGYTGCHLYKITATSTKTIQNASVRLTELTTTAKDTASWSYVIYTNDGTVNTISAEEGTNDKIVATSDFKTFGETYTAETGFDMHNNSALTENAPVYYYLLVYLANKDEVVQNPTGEGAADNADNGTGTYSGKVSMDALGGKVVASFSASA